MKELGLLEHTLKKITKKGQKHKFLKISSDLFITVDKTKEEIEKTGLLKRIFKEGIKIGGIGIASIITLFLSNYDPNKQEINRGSSEIDKTFNLFKDSINFEFTYFSIIITLSIILVGVFLIYKFKKKD